MNDEQIVEWADEAEAGYNVADLKKRGRPRIGTHVAQVATLRLDPELSAALNERAMRDHTTRSGVMRDALRSWLQAQ